MSLKILVIGIALLVLVSGCVTSTESTIGDREPVVTTKRIEEPDESNQEVLTCVQQKMKEQGYSTYKISCMSDFDGRDFSDPACNIDRYNAEVDASNSCNNLIEPELSLIESNCKNYCLGVNETLTDNLVKQEDMYICHCNDVSNNSEATKLIWQRGTGFIK